MLKLSYSRIDNFKTCPRQYEARYVTGEVVFESTEQTRLGDRFHKAAEERLLMGNCMPPEFAQYEDVIDQVAHYKGKMLVEEEFAVRKDKTTCGYNDDDYWIRGRIDVAIILECGRKALLFDWKTGAKVRDSLQLSLMALLLFAKYPSLAQINTGLVFIKLDEIVSKKIYRQDVDDLWARFENEIAHIEAAHEKNTFVPKPSGLCKNYCPVKRCVFHGKGMR